MGHTGDLKAVIRACTVVDKCLGELLKTVDDLGGRWLVASDHGNADDMVQVCEPLQQLFFKGRFWQAAEAAPQRHQGGCELSVTFVATVQAKMCRAKNASCSSVLWPLLNW